FPSTTLFRSRDERRRTLRGDPLRAGYGRRTEQGRARRPGGVAAERGRAGAPVRVLEPRVRARPPRGGGRRPLLADGRDRLDGPLRATRARLSRGPAVVAGLRVPAGDVRQVGRAPGEAPPGQADPGLAVGERAGG